MVARAGTRQYSGGHGVCGSRQRTGEMSSGRSRAEQVARAAHPDFDVTSDVHRGLGRTVRAPDAERGTLVFELKPQRENPPRPADEPARGEARNSSRVT